MEQTELSMQKKGYRTRNSGIELLKVIAMLCIVTGHTTGTWDKEMLLPAYRYGIGLATTGIGKIFLNLLGYGGSFGNHIFFICSAWFLLDRNKVDAKKITRMIATVWSVSVGILLLTAPLFWGQIATKDIIKSFFPTTFAANWYLTCYMIFYAAHPFLNSIVDSVKQRTLLSIVLVMDLLYLCVNYVQIVELLFVSQLIVWTALYFTVAYVKLYLKDTASDVKKNLVGMLAGLAGQLAVFLATNYLGLRIAFFHDKVITWGGVSNPFFALSVICMLNLARQAAFHSGLINKIASLSMLVYIIHENVMVRTYLRPWLLNRIMEHLEGMHVLPVTLLFAGAIFVTSVCLSLVYERTLQKLVYRVSDSIHRKLCAACRRLEDYLLSWH